MSRNSKQVKKKTIAKQFTALHLQGKRGPAKTKKLHTKVKTWYAARKAGHKHIPVRRDDDD